MGGPDSPDPNLIDLRDVLLNCNLVQIHFWGFHRSLDVQKCGPRKEASRAHWPFTFYFRILYFRLYLRCDLMGRQLNLYKLLLALLGENFVRVAEKIKGECEAPLLIGIRTIVYRPVTCLRYQGELLAAICM